MRAQVASNCCSAFARQDDSTAASFAIASAWHLSFALVFLAIAFSLPASHFRAGSEATAGVTRPSDTAMTRNRTANVTCQGTSDAPTAARTLFCRRRQLGYARTGAGAIAGRACDELHRNAGRKRATTAGSSTSALADETSMASATSEPSWTWNKKPERQSVA